MWLCGGEFLAIVSERCDVWVFGWKLRERETERERQRETGRQTDRQRQTDKETETERGQGKRGKENEMMLKDSGLHND